MVWNETGLQSEMKLYLDIETTGLSATSNELTVVGALRGSEFVQLVQGKNLDRELVESLFAGSNEVVSFNGIRFDVPFLRSAYPTICVPSVHKDLMYAGWNVGLKGGLKSLEVQLGISRSSGVKNGYEAVLLWKKYLKGCTESLDRLLAYNREDVLNLPVLEKKLEARRRRLDRMGKKDSADLNKSLNG